MSKPAFDDFGEAIDWIIDESLSRLGESWKYDQKLRDFLFDAMASDPTVLEVLRGECAIENLNLCDYFCPPGG